MKVKFKYGIATYSGTIDQMVYGSFRNGKLCIGREYVYPRITAQNKLIGKIGVTLAEIWDEASEDFKKEFKTYAQRNGTEHVPKTQMPPNSYALWVQMLWRWADDESGLTLETMTQEDFVVSNSKIASVKAAVENGYLKKVFGWEEMIATY